MVITPETPVRDIAVEVPTVIPVLERLGVDYCCHGQHTLAEACAKKDLSLAPVLEEIERQQKKDSKQEESQWAQAPLKDLAEYIVKKHHAFTREQLTLIDSLMTKVEQRHGADHPEVFQVSKIVAVMGSELKHHSNCEETTLFPYIATLGTAQKTELPSVAMGTAQVPINRMMMDHDVAGEELRTLRKMTNNYVPPPAACPTWRALYRAMEELELDLHQHIHLENNILFPRALEQERLESRKSASSAGEAA